MTTYTILLLFFLTLLGRGPLHLGGKPLIAFVGIVVSGAVTKVSTVCINICVERDWASTISRGSSSRLTNLNAWLRRIVNSFRGSFDPLTSIRVLS
jgi:solute carrier family 40 (iron-regulated transporter), member 1